MKKYLVIFHLSFQNLLEYRMNFLWQILGGIIFTLMLYFFWVSILGTGFGKDKYSAGSLGLYYLSIAFINIFTRTNSWRIADDIRHGKLANDLLKPYNYRIKLFFNYLPEKLVVLSIFLTIYGIFASHNSVPEINFLTFLTAFYFLWTAAILKFFISLFFGGLAFWFKRIHGFNALFFNLGGIFSGELIPIDLLPTALLNFSSFLPFKYLGFVPAYLFLGKGLPEGVGINLMVNLSWVIVFYLIAKIVWSRGIRHFEAVGL